MRFSNFLQGGFGARSTPAQAPAGPRAAESRGRWMAVAAALAVGAAVSAWPAIGSAQVVAPNVAVPFYAPADFAQGAYRDWYAPQSKAFAAEAAHWCPRCVRAATPRPGPLATRRWRLRARNGGAPSRPGTA